MANGWTEERRKRQADMIRKHKPWEKSTGPRTFAGKERVALNALKHGVNTPEYQHIKQVLYLNKAFLKHVAIFEQAQDIIRKKLMMVRKTKTDAGTN